MIGLALAFLAGVFCTLALAECAGRILIHRDFDTESALPPTPRPRSAAAWWRPPFRHAAASLSGSPPEGGGDGGSPPRPVSATVAAGVSLGDA